MRKPCFTDKDKTSFSVVLGIFFMFAATRAPKSNDDLEFVPFLVGFGTTDTNRGVAKGAMWGVPHPLNIQFDGKSIISDHQTTVRMLYLLLILFQTSMIYNGIFVFCRQIDDI